MDLQKIYKNDWITNLYYGIKNIEKINSTKFCYFNVRESEEIKQKVKILDTIDKFYNVNPIYTDFINYYRRHWTDEHIFNKEIPLWQKSYKQKDCTYLDWYFDHKCINIEEAIKGANIYIYTIKAYRRVACGPAEDIIYLLCAKNECKISEYMFGWRRRMYAAFEDKHDARYGAYYLFLTEPGKCSF